MQHPDADPSSPLAGIAVIEVGHSVAAPYAGQILADLGATVLKIENPRGGDDARNWVPPAWFGSSAVFQTLNRNKYSIAVDLKTPKGQHDLERLIANADIVIQNMRPGLMQQQGLDAQTMRAKYPRLIYCNLGAFGSIGPMDKHTGYDPLIQAFSGIMSVTGEADRPPVRVGPSIVDMGSGLWCVIGVLAALAQRQKTGEGATVDTSLFEAGIAWMNIPIANTMASGRDARKSGSETPMLAPYRAFRASDKYLVIAAGNDNLFRRLCEAMERPEWIVDPRFLTNAHRVENRVALNALLDELIGTRSEQYWTAKLNEVGVPCAPLQSPSEVIAHPQTEALGMLRRPANGEMSLVALPLRFDGIRPAVRSKAPALGDDTDRAASLLAERPRWIEP
jgi:crotonobetainyl-CoA:carnitine CoA-transferase CaiB-like acyl-CoA transferase